MTLEREMRLEESAASARSLLFAYDGLPIDLTIALKRLADWPVTPRASYAVLSNDRMRFDEAYTDGDQKIIYLSNTTFEELQRGSTRKRFTVAHELGHVYLNHRGVRSRALGRDFRVQAGVFGAPQEEADADFWAAAFLMPLKIVRSCKTAEELAGRTHVSLPAARIRLDEVMRRDRLVSRQLRPISARTQDAISALREDVKQNALRARTPERPPPAEFATAVREHTAVLQGFLSSPCKVCGNYELVEEGGCTTCRKCGDSNCC